MQRTARRSVPATLDARSERPAKRLRDWHRSAPFPFAGIVGGNRAGDQRERVIAGAVSPAPLDPVRDVQPIPNLERSFRTFLPPTKWAKCAFAARWHRRGWHSQL